MKILETMLSTVGEQYLSHAKLKNWIATFRRRTYLTEGEDQSGKSISGSTSQHIDAIHNMILSDRRVRF